MPGYLLFYFRARAGLRADDTRQGLRDLIRYVESAPGESDHEVAATIILEECAGGKRQAAELLRKVTGEDIVAARARLWQGILDYFDYDRKAAESALNQFLQREPHHLRGLYWRCKVRLELGNGAGAVSDYREILRSHPKLGRGFDEEAALLKLAGGGGIPYGRRQMDAVLRDRPRMGTHFDPENPLHYWAAFRFEAKVNKLPIGWDPLPYPATDADAYNIPAEEGRGWQVNLSDTYRTGAAAGKERPVDRLWWSLIFELENVTGREVTDALEERAQDGQISEREYIEGIVRSEYQAKLRTRAFFVLVYYPWCIRKGLSPIIAEWPLGDTLTLEDLLCSRSPDDPSEWKKYRAQYQRLRRSDRPAEK